jgi:hypothetical protein
MFLKNIGKRQNGETEKNISPFCLSPFGPVTGGSIGAQEQDEAEFLCNNIKPYK